MQAIDLLRPAFLLAGWTLLITTWMFVTRIPAMAKLKIDPQDAADTSKLSDLLPPEVQRVANNYNHLFEQPTLFYAVALMITAIGAVDELHVWCAWLFVGLRIVHSCVQATVDIVPIRFGIFLIAWLVLAVMILRSLPVVFA